MAAGYIDGYTRKVAKKLAISRQRLRLITRHVKRGRFLDVGSNYGFMTEVAGQSGFDATGLEINPGLAQHAAQTYPLRRFVCSPLETFDAGGAQFDAVYCSEVIRNHRDRSAALSRVAGPVTDAARRGMHAADHAGHIREYRRRRYRQMKAPDHKVYFNRTNSAAAFAGIVVSLRVRIRFNPFKGIILTAPHMSGGGLDMPRGPGGWIRRGCCRARCWGRSLLMILLPLLILEGVAVLQVFYGSHINVVSRRLAGSVASEISFTIDLMDRFPDAANRAWILDRARSRFALAIRLDPGARLATTKSVNVFGPMDDDLATALTEGLHLPFFTDWTSDSTAVLVQVQVPDGVLEVRAPRKSLYVMTFYLFVLWVVGVAALVFAIAALFMRNQVRAIRRLAAAAEAFGLGREADPIKPEGALEVRRAGTAFNRMQERIRRFLAQRTEMLAGVSHDLRTPLTRLRLTLAMLPARRGELRDDIAGR